MMILLEFKSRAGGLDVNYALGGVELQGLSETLGFVLWDAGLRAGFTTFGSAGSAAGLHVIFTKACGFRNDTDDSVGGCRATENLVDAFPRGVWIRTLV